MKAATQRRDAEPRAGRRVLFAPYTGPYPTWGHLLRCLAVADRMAALGYGVTFAAEAAARARVGRSGHAFVEHAWLKRRWAWAATFVRDATRAERTSWFGRVLEASRRTIRAARPSVVVTDLHPVMNVAAALEGVPSVSLLNIQILAFPLDMWLESLAGVFVDLDLPRWAARRVYGDALVIGDTPLATGLRDLSAAEVQVIAGSVREVHFVGPVLARDPTEAPPWTPPRPGARHRVLVYMGGSPDKHTALGAILAGCAEVDATFVAVTPRPWSAALRRTRERAARGGRAEVVLTEFIPDFADQLRTASALITHGGHGTLMEALAIGVPTLVVPSTDERRINARRVRGVGDWIAGPTGSLADVIARRVAALLDDRARDGARTRLAAVLASYGGARQAAAIVDRVASQEAAALA